jgi:hypothetical protein
MKKVILYHLWGVFSVYGFTTPITAFCTSSTVATSLDILNQDYI